MKRRLVFAACVVLWAALQLLVLDYVHRRVVAAENAALDAAESCREQTVYVPVLWTDEAPPSIPPRINGQLEVH